MEALPHLSRDDSSHGIRLDGRQHQKTARRLLLSPIRPLDLFSFASSAETFLAVAHSLLLRACLCVHDSATILLALLRFPGFVRPVVLGGIPCIWCFVPK